MFQGLSKLKVATLSFVGILFIFGFSSCKLTQKAIPPFFQDTKATLPSIIEVQVP